MRVRICHKLNLTTPSNVDVVENQNAHTAAIIIIGGYAVRRICEKDVHMQLKFCDTALKQLNSTSKSRSASNATSGSHAADTKRGKVYICWSKWVVLMIWLFALFNSCDDSLQKKNVMDVICE